MEHIFQMYGERLKEGKRKLIQKMVEEHNNRPRPCPYCGKEPEIVEETIYPGEVLRYVVCSGESPLPHAISIHGGDDKRAVKEGLSVEEWILKAVEEKLEKDNY